MLKKIKVLLLVVLVFASAFFVYTVPLVKAAPLTFGDKVAHSAAISIEGGIRGSNYTCLVTCTAQNITVYLGDSSTSNDWTGKVKCGVYVKGTSVYVGTTEEKTITLTMNNANRGWFVFNFTGGLLLTGSVQYILCCWAESKTGYCEMGQQTGKATRHTQTLAYGSWPAPLVPTNSSNLNLSIYCSYIVGSSWTNRAPTFSNPGPGNGTTNIDLYNRTSVMVSDLDGNSTTVCLWTNASGSWVKSQQNNSVPANSTIRDMNSTWITSNSHTYWWKVTAYDGHANISAVYHFTTEDSSGTYYALGVVSGSHTGYNTLYDYCNGRWVTPVNGDGYLNNITVKLRTIVAETTTAKVKCAVYEYVDYSSSYAGAFITETEEKTVSLSYGGAWFVFNFTSDPYLTNGVSYYLIVTGQAVVGTNGRLCNMGTSGGVTDVYENRGAYGFENPWAGESASASTRMIGGYYTPTAGVWTNRAPVISNPSPSNGSSGSILYPTTSVLVSDADGNATTVCFWNNKTGSWVKAQQNNSVTANSTVRDMNASYVTGHSTSYWWKVTAYDSHVNISAIYHFTTSSTTSPPGITLIYPSNGTTASTIPFVAPSLPPSGNFSLKWSKSFSTYLYMYADTPPTAVDVNNDGVKEIFSTGRNYPDAITSVVCVCLNGTTGNLIWTKSTTQDGSYTFTRVNNIIYDFNKDGKYEIVYGTGTHLLCRDAEDGDLLWNASIACGKQEMAYVDYGSVVLLYVAGFDTGYLNRIWASNGTLINRVAISYMCYGGVTIADMKHDGNLRIFTTARNTGGGLVCYDEALNFLWNYPVSSSSHCCITANVTGDSDLEVLVSNQGGVNSTTVYVLDADGNMLFNTGAIMSVQWGMSIGDIDGDGHVELIDGGHEGTPSKVYPHIYDLTTHTLETTITHFVTFAPSIVNVIPDTSKEFVVGHAGYNTQIYKYDSGSGTYKVVDTISYGATFSLVQDFDHDGYNEMLIEYGTNSFKMYETKAVASSPEANTETGAYGVMRWNNDTYYDEPGSSENIIPVDIPPTCIVNVTGINGLSLTVTFYTNESGSWVLKQTNTSVPENTIVRWDFTDADTASTRYWWRVNVTNGYNTTSCWYTFMTSSGATAPLVTSEYPTNNSISINFTTLTYFKIYVFDANGYDVAVYWKENHTMPGTWNTFATNLTGGNGLRYAYDTSWVTDYSTTYYWMVCTTNGYTWSNYTFHFTTVAAGYIPPSIYPVIMVYYDGVIYYWYLN
jgi:hypothetical protein